jgi:ABC-type glycerol-3-phosphate transport system permease component
MMLPSAMVVWNMILARTFFMSTIPKELYESAEIDGASDIKILTRIVLPLSSPILAVLTLFYAVSTHWNSYFDAMMYLKSQRLYNIQLVLRNAIASIESMLNQTGDLSNVVVGMAMSEASKYVIIVISMLPVLVIYPFVQKYFIKGIMIGAIKG